MTRMIHVVTLGLSVCLSAMWGQAAAPAPGHATERPTTEQLAKLKSGPALPYAVDANWPQMPKGYNFGECSGVDVDKQGNVWVFNRGHWPVMEFDRNGKLLQAWSRGYLPREIGSRPARRARTAISGCVDVEGHVVFKMSPEGRILMVLGNRQGSARE